jgi:hypothetical protein
MFPVPLFDLKFLEEIAASGAGTSNRRHWSSSAAITARNPDRFQPAIRPARSRSGCVESDLIELFFFRAMSDGKPVSTFPDIAL